MLTRKLQWRGNPTAEPACRAAPPPGLWPPRGVTRRYAFDARVGPGSVCRRDNLARLPPRCPPGRAPRIRDSASPPLAGLRGADSAGCTVRWGACLLPARAAADTRRRN